MMPLVSYFLAVSFLLIVLQDSVIMEECTFRKLDREDKIFCRGGLEIFYPELGDVGCTYIPRCNAYRKRISKEWINPEVKYQQADTNKKYVLIMVDPDAPSRSNPMYRFWRHWAVTDISGADLKKGNLKGHVLADYLRPTPPPGSGYHRYQFLLYEQPAHEDVSLNSDETTSSGSWNVNNFVDRFHLGTPVASTQFVTKDYHD
ncbi:phosphatidylethanolamine-binding protein 4 [Pseudonaja textilis]|uniref:phosphatidylethanolamine-binding protein 4 n=1 Tax=Pseudonaja textilis TaxID=8673 RepID=UPI000EAA0EDF|nr:phosphatidylethanolamine-binding protein 4 [Pseudonaja textilis]XP_026570987.1 phosphatidylethanolamine-binding protein 4 [Pseudonaja textilis]